MLNLATKYSSLGGGKLTLSIIIPTPWRREGGEQRATPTSCIQASDNGNWGVAVGEEDRGMAMASMLVFGFESRVRTISGTREDHEGSADAGMENQKAIKLDYIRCC
jgi:hypothetical protein